MQVSSAIVKLCVEANYRGTPIIIGLDGNEQKNTDGDCVKIAFDKASNTASLTAFSLSHRKITATVALNKGKFEVVQRVFH
ncbi:hypothetical protein F6X40_34740 [Paraburkholderia sp. UCT31]|uniref:hypothetical protein n=1 Tax=Paraburkholderia sp. UCT31 TaxID=2615209 RepID=UPI001656723C|nr:hypothetical protein [Paraburkholderia sp. UCT31]MBC8741720.1 hypothetical protein [Paraburkholderia sp. UCT31]